MTFMTLFEILWPLLLGEKIIFRKQNSRRATWFLFSFFAFFSLFISFSFFRPQGFVTEKTEDEAEEGMEVAIQKMKDAISKAANSFATQETTTTSIRENMTWTSVSRRELRPATTSNWRYLRLRQSFDLHNSADDDMEDDDVSI